VGILHFLDADSRQTLDRFAGEEHLPQVEFAAKMEPYLEEVETALLKAFDLLPSEGAGEKVVSLKQLLQPQSLVLSPKKMPSLASPKESGETSKPKQTRKKSATKKSEDSDKKSPKPS
jgi:hypothetical protein